MARRGEWRHRKKEWNDYRRARSRAESVNLAGGRGLVLVRDITDLKRATGRTEDLEEQLRQALKWNAYRDGSAGGVGSTCNNLLRSSRPEPLVCTAWPPQDLAAGDSSSSKRELSALRK